MNDQQTPIDLSQHDLKRKLSTTSMIDTSFAPTFFTKLKKNKENSANLYVAKFYNPNYNNEN